MISHARAHPHKGTLTFSSPLAGERITELKQVAGRYLSRTAISSIYLGVQEFLNW
jgi:hypothetical protein